MNKKAKRVLAALLSVMTASSMATIAMTSASAAEMTYSQVSNAEESKQSDTSGGFSNKADTTLTDLPMGTGDIRMSKEEVAKAKKIKTVKDYYNTVDDAASTTKTAKQEIAANSTSTSSVDNSKSKYFPPIGNQGELGSCTCWANIYYQLSYEENRQLNRTATAENSLSPTWVYPYVNGGGDNGSSATAVMQIAKNFGAPTVKSAPITTDFAKWNTDKSTFEEAQQYRLSDYYVFYTGAGNTPVTSPDDSDIAAIKTSLKNGDVLTFSTYIQGWNYEEIKENSEVPENSKYAGEYVASYAKYAGGAHRMTIVGYNDDIWVDINHDGKVQEGEKGAFKIANSWGVNYSQNYDYLKDNEGYIWLSYDMLNTVSSVDNAYLNHYRMNLGATYLFSDVVKINVEPVDYNSGINLEYTLNTSLRGNTRVFVIASNGDKTYSSSIEPFSGMDYSETGFDGTDNATDGTFIYDLSNIVPGLNSSNFKDYSWSVEFIDNEPYSYSSKEDSALTISNVKVTDKNSGKSYGTTNFKKKVTINNTQIIADINNGYTDDENAPLDFMEFSLQDGNESAQTDVVSMGAWAIGGSAPYQYKFSYTLNGKETVLQDFNQANILEHKFTEVGDYTLKVVVKDDNGNTKTATTNLTVKKTEIKSINIKEYITDNGLHYFNIISDIQNLPSASNYMSIDYDAVIDGNEEVINRYIDENNQMVGIWKPNNYGTYQVTVSVKDNSDIITQKTVNYKVDKNNSPLGMSAISIYTYPANYTKNEIGVGTYFAYDGFSAYGGQTPYMYRAGYIKDGKTYYVSDYTSYSTGLRCDGVNEPGTIKPFVTVKDAGGQTLTKYADDIKIITGFKINDIYLNSSNSSYTEDGVYIYKAGNEAYLSFSGENYAKDENSRVKSCVYTIKKDGYKYAEISNNVLSTSTIFTPNEAGTYEVTVKVTDQLNQTATFTKSFIFVKSDNLATIYYKGFDTPYIHYKVDNKSWSQAPGYSMPTTNAYQDYTNTFTIDLGNASGAEICFNNGNGTWDSRNGANYRLGAGKYTYSNGKLEKIDDKVLQIKKFIANNGKSEYEPPYKSTAAANNFTVVASGGTAPYTYQYGYIKDNQRFVFNTEFTEYDSVSLLLTMGGTITPFVVVKDATGATVEQYAQQIKSNKLTAKVSIQQNGPYKVNNAITFDTVVKHATLSPAYSLGYIFTISQDDKIIARASSGDGTIDWTPSKPGKYTLNVYVLDAIDQVDNTTITFDVVDNTPLSLDSFNVTPDKTYNGVFENFNMSANVSGGTAPYQYKFSYEKYASEYTISDFSSKDSASIQLPEIGPYTLKVTVKDADGNTVTKSKQVAIGQTYLSDIQTSKATAKTGETVKLTPNIHNEASTITSSDYIYTVKKNGKTQTLTTSSDKTANWTPTEAGTYTLNLDVKHSGVLIACYSKSFTVEKNNDANEVTIYYSGYSTPYIHYQVGNGSWTNAPGYAMTKTSEMSGYTHKYTIDLKNATYATVCFNNGNGSWDSNNGQNYRFEKGTYTFKNGNITPVDDGATRITSFDITPADGKIKIGDSVSMHVNVANADSTTMCKFSYKEGNGTVNDIYNYSTTFSCSKQFTKAGTYTLIASVKDGSGNVVTAEKTITVTDNTVQKNSVTIYYKGYSTPYIHYQVGNGSWTNAPGFAMTATNEKSGYTHKYTIDLKNATYATVCFNNGNGSWDSNNGQNYRFEKGTYTYSNGTLTKIS